MEDYEKKYKEAMARMESWARGEHPECFSEAQKAAEFVFPELKKSEDEKIKEDLIAWFKNYPVGCVYGEVVDYIFDKHTGKIRPYIAIHKFEVRKNMRGKGIGRIMYNTLLETLNPYLITLYFLDDNALEFWKHIGFKRHRKSDQLYCKI